MAQLKDLSAEALGSTQWPNVMPALPKEDYANDIEVTEGEHDVTLRFFRTSDNGSTGSRRLVKAITVPRSLWDRLTKRKK